MKNQGAMKHCPFYSWITRLSRLCILGCFFPVFSGHVHSGLCILFTYCPSQNFDVPAFVCGTKFSWLNFGNMCQVTLHPGMDGMVAGVGAGVTIVTGAGSSGAGSAGAAAAIHGGPQTCGDALRWQSRGKRKLLIIRRWKPDCHLSPHSSLLLQIFGLYRLKQTWGCYTMNLCLKGGSREDQANKCKNDCQ